MENHILISSFGTDNPYVKKTVLESNFNSPPKLGVTTVPQT